MYLGIDIGTSSVKAVLVDADGAVSAQAAAPLTVQRPHPGYSEQDPEDWWRATIAAVTALPAAQRAAVQAVGLSGQMHGATLLDRRERPLRAAILWNDGRASRECAELERREPRVRQITGNPVMPGFTAPKLLWVASHEPELFERTASVLLPKDYVRLRLTGEKISDLSDASGTAWLDVARRDWSEALLEASALTRAHMPALVEGSAPAGRVRAPIASELGIPAVMVAGGGGDNAASAVGLGIVASGQALLSLGTSGVLFVATDRFLPNPERAAHAFCHCLPARWHQMAVLLNAAGVLDWMASLTGMASTDRLVELAGQTHLRRHSPLLLPYLSGERTPHNNPHARGVLFGLAADTAAPQLALAALEGVAHAFAEGLEVLTAAGSQVGPITVLGGGARWPLWGELIAAALRRPLTYRVGAEVGAALGAARLARLAEHGEPLEQVCTAPSVLREVAPAPALADLLQERGERFRRLYKDLESSFVEYAS